MKKRYLYLILLSSLALITVLFFQHTEPKEIPVQHKRPGIIVKEIPAEEIKEKKHPIESQPTVKKTTGQQTDKVTSFINPPLPSAAIPFTNEKISATSGKTIVSSKNTTITVPPNAFVDDKGNVVKGNVDLHYREYHDHSDIFLSGIPMTYENGHLESAGMIEITASLKNNPVFVNPASRIKVEMASSNKDPDFNLYYLDTLDKQWKLKEKNLAAVKIKTDDDAPAETEDAINNSEWGSNTLTRINGEWIPLKNSKTYFYDRKEKITIDRKKVTLIEPQVVSGNYYNFQLDLSEYPELSVYSNLRWQTIDSKNKRVVSGIFPEKIKLVGNPAVRILNRIGESDSFNIRIAGSISSVDVVFQPVFEAQDYQLAKITYQQLLVAHMDSDNKDLADELKKQKTDFLTRRSFQISNFGIWNCDRIYQIPQARTITVKLIRDDTEEPLSSSFYLINKKINTVITYYSDRKNNFTYSELGDNLVWTLLEDGRVAVCSFNKPSNPDIEGEQVLKVKVIDQEINSPEDVKKILASI